jgi:hydroxyethylthiazole kinase-like uncharacterized protein yjeF
MVKFVSVEEMKAIEQEANNKGLAYEQMMENAGRGLAEEINVAYSHISPKKVFALIGSGNNGGDALVALCHLISFGWSTCAYIVSSRSVEDKIIERYAEAGGEIKSWKKDRDNNILSDLLNTNKVLIDGVLGTGIRLPLKEDIAEVLLFVRQYLENHKTEMHVVAVDCPSGVDCNTGDVAAESFPAEMTVTMAAVKKGLLCFPAANFTGQLRVVNIGLLESIDNWNTIKRSIINNEYVKEILPQRPLNAHKGTFGTVFIIAGSVNYTGAALLAGKAAYRIGAGLVTMVLPASLHPALAGHFPEATWILLPHEMGVIASSAVQVVEESIGHASAILLGPGLGLEDTTKDFIARLISTAGTSIKSNIGFIHDNEKLNPSGQRIHQPVVIDADGLKLLAKIQDWEKFLPLPAILTPHPGEMAVLTGLPISEIQSNRIAIAERYSSMWGHVVVLKGAFSIIASPDGYTAIVPIATPALARAGTGDVLAGLIVGLRTQGVEAFQAACAGSWIHANAGLVAAKKLGNTASVMAGDVLDAVPQVISELY